MNSENKFNLTEFELDQLKEIVNIGTSSASTALSQMIGKKVLVNILDVNFDTVEESVEYIGESSEVVTAVLLRLLGDATGMMLFVFPEESGHRTVRLIAKTGIIKEFLTEYDRSLLREVGNILAGACLTALSKFIGLNVYHSVAEVATDMLGAIVSSAMAEVGKASDIALIFKVNMTIEDEDIKTQLFFMLDPAFTTKMLKLTKERYLK